MEKSRRPFSILAVLIGNLYLRWQRAKVEVLLEDEWLRWEKSVSTALRHGQPSEVATKSAHSRFGCLVCPSLSGKPLSDILADPSRALGCRLQCVRLAVLALQRLHQHEVDWGGGVIQSLSHGDATAENVIIDLLNQTAHWIDFDIRHVSTLAAVDRQADDLRALIFSAAVHFSRSDLRSLAILALETYGRHAVVVRMQKHLANGCHHLGAFQLAQAPLSFAKCRELYLVLRGCLPS